MEVIKLTQETDSNGNLALTIPTEQKSCKLEVIVVISSKETPKKKPPIDKYFGKLKWQGEALTEQRRLRDEWS
ncbi:MAG: hypothetical protein H7A23_22205 [Leptospiraceae bacterium]|nr:hypothetical protein [Leptospiraceae bacterium]MCP5497275.1 hypothetical protein [Leptospiraceae bacterium]